MFATTEKGARVRFDRVTPAPFTIDIGTREKLVLNMNGGDDFFSATGNLAGLIQITVDGGTGTDTIPGSNGADTLLGGDGDDFADGQKGNDTAFLGAGDDNFQWYPGDGSDTVEGQDGSDSCCSTPATERDRCRLGQRSARSRDAQRQQHADGHQRCRERQREVARRCGHRHRRRSFGNGRDQCDRQLASLVGGDDAAADNVIVNGTGGDDVATVAGTPATTQVAGLAVLVSVSGGTAGSDRLRVNGQAGERRHRRDWRRRHRDAAHARRRPRRRRAPRRRR